MRRMNREFLRHDWITDVLAFPLERDMMNLEGEIYVNLDRAEQQSRSYGVSMKHELARLVIHGMLHLLGQKDSTPSLAERMRQRENTHLEYWFNRKGKSGT
jgi:probable rRNA maturation factor